MARAIAQVTLFRKGNLPENNVVNTMHFESDAPTPGQGAFEDFGPGLMNRIATFYQAIGTTWLSPVLSGNGRVTLYDWANAKPRIPRMSLDFVHGKANQSMPAEVALCISFKAVAAAGVNPARRRGRIFLGPLNSSVAGLGGDESDVRPDVSALDGLIANFKTMATGSTGGAFRLAIYSPTQGAISGQDDESWNDAVTIWADNAFDTIRKRGAKATARATVAI